MAIADFIHLRTHSAYSLSTGSIKVKDLVGLCKKQKMPAVGVTDSGNLFGALEFSIEAAAKGVQPIIGCEIGIRAPQGDGGRGIGRRIFPSAYGIPGCFLSQRERIKVRENGPRSSGATSLRSQRRRATPIC